MHPIINIANVELESLPASLASTGSPSPRLARLAHRLGSDRLGANLIALAPGSHAFPFHSHRSSDELFYVLSGNGELRLGSLTHAIRAGDFIACPAGGPETAHQIRNTGDTELRYLAIGVHVPLDIVEYPDTGEFRAYAGEPGQMVFDATARIDPAPHHQPAVPKA